MNNAIRSLGGRRFALALVAGISATVLQYFSKLDSSGTAYSMVMIATVAAYITGNVVDRKFATIPLPGAE